MAAIQLKFLRAGLQLNTHMHVLAHSTDTQFKTSCWYVLLTRSENNSADWMNKCIYSYSYYSFIYYLYSLLKN